jgi:hypothetical protein
MLLFYKNGIRVCIHTANYIRRDWSYKTQACWYQDFPLKSEEQKVRFFFFPFLLLFIKLFVFSQKEAKPNDFEETLVDYFSMT